MLDKLFAIKNVIFMFITSFVLNVARIATKAMNMEPIDIDIALMGMLILLFIQFIRTAHKIAGYGIFFILYASIVMFINYFVGFPDVVNLALFIPLLLAAIYSFFLALKRFR